MRASEPPARHRPSQGLALPDDEARAIRERLSGDALDYARAVEDDGASALEFLPGPMIVLRCTVFPQEPAADKTPQRVAWIDPLVERPDGTFDLLRPQYPAVGFSSMLRSIDDDAFVAAQTLSALGDLLVRNTASEGLKQAIRECIARAEAVLIAVAAGDSASAAPDGVKSASSVRRPFHRAL